MTCSTRRRTEDNENDPSCRRGDEERNAHMKKAENRATRKGFMLQQCIREASGVRQLRGRHHDAPASSPVMPGCGRLTQALGELLSRTPPLFSLVGKLASTT